LKIQKGQFVLVLGEVGSGKSSLLLSILNEMNKSKVSSVVLNGSVGYVCHPLWIQSGTVVENIIFGQR